ncbi:HD domain-containing protein [Leptospira interrogans]
MLKAAHQAAVWHAGQRRKGAKQEPYINHLLEVSQLVASSPEGRGDENVIIAGLLHDAIEDQRISATTIAEMFNRDVADLVLEVTDDKRLNKLVRKDLHIINAWLLQKFEEAATRAMRPSSPFSGNPIAMGVSWPGSKTMAAMLGKSDFGRIGPGLPWPQPASVMVCCCCVTPRQLTFPKNDKPDCEAPAVGLVVFKQEGRGTLASRERSLRDDDIIEMTLTP